MPKGGLRGGIGLASEGVEWFLESASTNGFLEAPTIDENVHFYGSHFIDIDGELAQLDTDAYRPLRHPATPST